MLTPQLDAPMLGGSNVLFDPGYLDPRSLDPDRIGGRRVSFLVCFLLDRTTQWERRVCLACGLAQWRLARAGRDSGTGSEKGLLTGRDMESISSMKLTMGEADYEIDLHFPCGKGVSFRSCGRGAAYGMRQFYTGRVGACPACGATCPARARRPAPHYGLRSGSHDQ